MPRSSKNPSAIALQARDFALLRDLLDSRILTIPHAAALYFDDHGEAAKKRIQKLKTSGLIGERPRRVNEPSVLFLTVKGFSLLLEHGYLTAYPKISASSFEKRAQVSILTLRHELEIMDVKATLSAAIAKTKRFTIAEFSTWPLLYQFTARRPSTGNAPSAEVLVKPDGFIRIHEQESDGGLSEHTFFLEVDRSTETQDTLAIKASCYNDFYRRGGLAVRNGQPASAYTDFPFRVLFVLKSTERRDNIANRLLQNNPPVLTQVWLTTREEITTDPLGAIWVRPIDYRESTKREQFIAPMLPKFGLLQS